MNLRLLCLVLCANLMTQPAWAARLACPDLSAAVQVNGCPTEEELQYTYTGYCSDNAKAYARETDACLRYADYWKMKNTVLWESKDGVFSAYLSCDLPLAELKAMRPTTMKIERQGKLSKLACSYPQGVKFTYRTRENCRIDNEAACAADATACQATCD